MDYMPSILEMDRPAKPPSLTIDVNFYGSYYSAMLALWYFAHSPPNPAKQLLFICSAAGYTTIQGPRLQGDCQASKFGLRGLFQQIQPKAKDY